MLLLDHSVSDTKFAYDNVRLGGPRYHLIHKGVPSRTIYDFAPTVRSRQGISGMNYVGKVLNDHQIVVADTSPEKPQRAQSAHKFGVLERPDLPASKLSCSLTNAEKAFFGSARDDSYSYYPMPRPRRSPLKKAMTVERHHKLFSKKVKIPIKKPGVNLLSDTWSGFQSTK